MLERVETEWINEETSWITEVPSVTSIITFLSYTLLKGCEIFSQAILCFMGGKYIYIHEDYLEIWGIVLSLSSKGKEEQDFNIVYF